MRSEDLEFNHISVYDMHKYADKKSLAPMKVSMKDGKFPFYGLKLGAIEIKPIPKWIGDVNSGETSS